LSFCTHQSQDMLVHMRVDEKTNKIPVALFLLPCLPVAGRVSTANAMQTRIAFLPGVSQLDGDMVLTVAATQPPLSMDRATSFADPHACSWHARTADDQRGCIEVRSVTICPDLSAFLTQWPGVAHVAHLRGTVTVRRPGKTSGDVVSLLTTRAPEQASPPCW